MNILISNLDSRPIYKQVYSQIKDLIISGKLKGGDPLPSMRNLAKELRISVITTKRAYEELEKEGFVESFTGKGTFVAERSLDLIREENLKLMEENLNRAIDLARISGISLDEILDLIESIYRGD